LRHFRPDFALSSLRPPADWPAVVTGHEPEAALAFCLGNYPQMVRDLHPLWQAEDLAALRPAPRRPVAAPGLGTWAADAGRKGAYPHLLLVAAVQRLAGELDAAAEALRQGQKKSPAEWRDALANEEAALAWHAGRADEAAALWRRQ